MFQLKAKVLEKMINDSLEELEKHSFVESEAFTIGKVGDIEVQVKITRDSSEHTGEVLKEYREA